MTMMDLNKYSSTSAKWCKANNELLLASQFYTSCREKMFIFSAMFGKSISISAVAFWDKN